MFSQSFLSSPPLPLQNKEIMGDPSLPDDLRIELAKSLQMNLFTKASLGGGDRLGARWGGG